MYVCQNYRMFVQDTTRIVKVRGMSSCTLNEIDLYTGIYEIIHIFRVVGEGMRIPYDAILCQAFFISES